MAGGLSALLFIFFMSTPFLTIFAGAAFLPLAAYFIISPSDSFLFFRWGVNGKNQYEYVYPIALAIVLIFLYYGPSQSLFSFLLFVIPYGILFLCVDKLSLDADKDYGKEQKNLMIIRVSRMVYFFVLYFVFMSVVLSFALNGFDESDYLLKIDGAIKQYQSTAGDEGYAGFDLDSIKFVLRYSPGLLCLMNMLILVASVFWANSFLESRKKSAKVLESFQSLDLPFALWIGFLVALLLAVFFENNILGIVSINVIVVIIGAFSLYGFAIAKLVLSPIKNGDVFFLLVVFFAIVFTFLFVIIAVVGLLEPWLQLRRRFCADC